MTVHANLPHHSYLKYLIDSDWVIDAQHNREAVINRIRQLAPVGLGISIISLAELYDGILGDPDPEESDKALRKFLDTFRVLSVDDEICRIFARERRRLRAAGTLIPDMDLLIGATAIRHNLTILTNNRRHFERLQGLSIISA